MKSFISFLEEKTLTPAELKKREQIAKAMERENPGMDMSKKMAIATSQAKKVAEGADTELTNLRRHTKWSSDRYDGMKKSGMHHHQIQKVWDDEVQAEIETAKMNRDNSAGKKAKK